MSLESITEGRQPCELVLLSSNWKGKDVMFVGSLLVVLTTNTSDTPGNPCCQRPFKIVLKRKAKAQYSLLIPGAEALKIRLPRGKKARKNHNNVTDGSLNRCLSLISGMSGPGPSLIIHINVIPLQSSSSFCKKNEGTVDITMSMDLFLPSITSFASQQPH